MNHQTFECTTPTGYCHVHIGSHSQAWNPPTSQISHASHSNKPLQVQKQHSSTLEQEGSLSITLDSYPLKTPGKAFTLALLETPLHNAYCDSGKTNTSLAVRMTDSMNEAVMRVDVCKALLNYLDTDMVCFHQDYPDPLVHLQNKHWDPLLTWACDTFDIELLTPTSMLCLTNQLSLTDSDFSDTFNNSKRHVSKTNCFKVIHQSSKSSSTTMLSPSAPFLVAQVEVTSQIKCWGEVEDGAYACHFVCPQNLTLNTQLMTLITMMYDGTLAIQPVYWLQSRHTQIPLSTSASSSRYSGNVPLSNAQNAAVCAPACRARYHNDITGVQQNRDWCDVTCEATNKKDSGIAEAVDGTLVNMRGDEKSEAYEIEASGEVAQSLEWSTWPIRVPVSGSTSTKCRLSDT
ncbi:hypothetical protein B0F90DRAFT_1859072 [Multifurca ochricompacta]|uniref:Uncharacterized protein n=1 Tax=Multifurca ochricompacta TaxID=376703 RepID=A0AAD4LT94_9AGAM|nr:hypothetical protein B0F90DRAFT_1859072 [Multifurca ochricompacta]